MPDKKTQSGIKSNSTIGGGGYNEIMFEDKKGSEDIRVHAQKDLDTTILHAETRKIGQNFETPMGSPSRETTLLMGDDKLTVASGHRDATIAQNDTLMVGMQQQHTIGVSRTTMIGTTETHTVGASQTTTVGASQTITVGGPVTIMSGATLTLMAGGSIISLSPAGITLVGTTINCVGATNIPMLTAAGTINMHP
jgi:type VI secretion system secreted protein VgrG